MSVNGGVRFGLYGTDLEWNADVDSDATINNGAIFDAGVAGTINPTLAKDALKGTRFGVYLADVNIDGNPTQNVAAHVTVRAVTPLTVDAAPYTPGLGDDGIVFDPTNVYGDYLGFGTPVPVFVDSLQLWDWYATSMRRCSAATWLPPLAVIRTPSPRGCWSAPTSTR